MRQKKKQNQSKRPIKPKVNSMLAFLPHQDLKSAAGSDNDGRKG